MSDSLSILVFGGGGIGAVYTHVLSCRNNFKITLVCRSNYETVKRHGFIINSEKFGKCLEVKPNVVRSATEATGPFTFVVVTTKAFPGSSPSTSQLIVPVVSKDTTIVLIQNGIGLEQEYKDAFPDNEIISCVVYLPVTQLSPGVIQTGAVEQLEMGTYPSTDFSVRMSILERHLKQGGSDVKVYKDIQVRKWGKLLLNASWNPICALTLSTVTTFLSTSSDAKSYVRQVIMEIVSIAQALGYTEITEEMAERQLQRSTVKVGRAGLEPSMLADRRAGRPMEVEAIVGNTMRIGQEMGVPVPRLEGLYFLTKALDTAIAGLHETTVSR